MPKALVGIDIGSYSIKVTKLTSYWGRFDFDDARELEIGEDESIAWEKVDLLLRDMLSDEEIRNGIFAAALPGEKIASHIIELPFSDDRKISQTLPFEVENHVPVPLEDLIFDYAVINKKDNHSKLLVLATRSSSVEEVIAESEESTGINLKYIEGDFTALTHLLPYIEKEEDETLMLVDIGHKRTSLSLATGEKIGLTRSVKLGAADLIKAASKAFNISIAEAQERLREGNLINLASGADEIPDQVESVLGEILSEFRVAINQAKVHELPSPGRILISGGITQTEGFPEFLEENLRIPVHYLDIQPELLMTTNDADKPLPPIYPVSFGLALRCLDQAKGLRINFRRGDFAYKSESEDYQKLFTWLGGLTTVLLILVMFSLYYKGSIEKAKVDALKQQIRNVFTRTLPEVKTIVNENHQLKSKIEEFRVKLSSIGVFAGNPVTMTDIIGEIAVNTKDVEIEIWDFMYEGDRIVMNAATTSFQMIEEIRKKLLQSALFETVEYSDARLGRTGEVNFKMTIRLEKTLP